MKSPICEVCGKDFRNQYFHTAKGGACLDFADYIELPEGAAGHACGSGWFCEEHEVEARSLLYLNLADAISKIRQSHSIKAEDLPTDYSNLNDPELWIESVGSNQSKVFSIIRDAMRISPKEAKELLASNTFKVISGWPTEFESIKQRLENCGAVVSVRYDT